MHVGWPLIGADWSLLPVGILCRSASQPEQEVNRLCVRHALVAAQTAV